MFPSPARWRCSAPRYLALPRCAAVGRRSGLPWRPDGADRYHRRPRGHSPDPRASRLTALKTIDGPRPPQEASSDGTLSCGGLGLADADPDERLDRASASTTEARLWP